MAELQRGGTCVVRGADASPARRKFSMLASVFLSPAALMTNHFYTYPTSDGKKVNFGLVLVETATAKVLAGECNLCDFIYWGANTEIPSSWRPSLTLPRS